MHVLVIANGAPADLPAPERLPETDLSLAADGGAANARRLGRRPSIVIGDMDSISRADRDELEAAGAEFITHPPKKDATDLELALRYAVQAGARLITIVGALGGRPDQTLANTFLLASPFLDGVKITLLGNDWEAFCVRDAVEFAGQPDDVVSLLPLTPGVTGVTTAGLYWALDDATLVFGSTLGISNVMTDDKAQISIQNGILLAVHATNSGDVDARQ